MKEPEGGWDLDHECVCGPGERWEQGSWGHRLGLLRMRSLCPTWACAQPCLGGAVNRPPHTSSLFLAHTNHHYHISQAHTNTTSTCPQIHSTQLTGPAPTAQTCKRILHPPHTHTHTHFTVRNKHRPCRLWEGRRESGAGVFPRQPELRSCPDFR